MILNERGRQKIGGKRWGESASLFVVIFTPDIFCLPLLFTSGQVVSLPHGITVEVDQTGNPFIEELLVEPLSVRDGQLSLSNAPGLGIELNPLTMQRYRLEDPLHLPDGSYSDMIFGKAFL